MIVCHRQGIDEAVMHRKSSLGSFVPWETYFLTEQQLRKAGELSFLPCHVQEASWIAGKQSASGRAWTFCQKGDVIDNTNPSLSSVEEDNSVKQQQQQQHQEGSHRTEFQAVKKESLRVHRSKLEYDVLRLEKRLEEELELRSAFENAHDHAMGVITNLPSHLPISAQKLLLDVATLEFAVSKLEQQMISLHCQLLQERSERENDELSYPESNLTGPADQLCHCLSPRSLSPSYLKPITRVQPSSPETFKVPSDRYSGASTATNVSSEDIFALEYTHTKSTHDHSEWQNDEQLALMKIYDEEFDLMTVSDDCKQAPSVKMLCAKDELWHCPNSLSEQMVQCMVDIYHHLSESAAQLRSLRDMPSPTSPFAHLVSSSMSSVSESSFISLARSPLVDLRSKGGAMDNFFDPYQTEEKMALPDLGAYKAALEVCWISVGKSQLNYAAVALKKFKTLVEQLARVDPGSMRHAEKVAFWINIYNALMMHAFLAYGTPENESRYFSLMHKASYVIGGYPINAITMKYAFLRQRVSTYQPQLELLLALKELRLSDQELKFGLTSTEPLTEFALSFGGWSCPAVRVYTVETIHEQLHASVRDYVRATVGMGYKSGKLMVPKLLYFHVRETEGEDASVFDYIAKQLSNSQLALIQTLMQQRPQKKKNGSLIQVLPFDFRFRYLFLCDGF